MCGVFVCVSVYMLCVCVHAFVYPSLSLSVCVCVCVCCVCARACVCVSVRPSVCVCVCKLMLHFTMMGELLSDCATAGVNKQSVSRTFHSVDLAQLRFHVCVLLKLKAPVLTKRLHSTHIGLVGRLESNLALHN